MYFNVMVIVWFGGGFYWFIDKLYVGIDWYIFKQEFDIVVVQMYVVVVYVKFDVEVGVGVVNSIQVIDVQCVQVYWVIWVCRYDCRQWFVGGVIFSVYFCCRCSGWIGFFMFNFGCLVDRCVFI